MPQLKREPGVQGPRHDKPVTPPGLYPGPSCGRRLPPSTLAAHLAYRRVRASSSVQVRTRTGRIRSVHYILYQSDRTV